VTYSSHRCIQNMAANNEALMDHPSFGGAETPTSLLHNVI